MIAKRKKRVLQKTITVHLRFLYFYHLCFLRGIRTGNVRCKFENFENILFANVNFEVFDAELRKRKQPDSDDANE